MTTKENCYASVDTMSFTICWDNACIVLVTVTRTCPVNCLSMHDSLKAQKANLSNERRVQKFSHWNAQLSSPTSIHPVDERRSTHIQFYNKSWDNTKFISIVSVLSKRVEHTFPCLFREGI